MSRSNCSILSDSWLNFCSQVKCQYFEMLHTNNVNISLLIVSPCIYPVYNALYLSIFCSLDFLTLYQMQTVIAAQVPPADSNERTRTTMIMVVVLSVGVATIPVGRLVGVLEAALRQQDMHMQQWLTVPVLCVQLQITLICRKMLSCTCGSHWVTFSSAAIKSTTLNCILMFVQWA